MSTLTDIFIKQNPLLAHGPRTHRTGITVPAASAPTRRPRARWDVDAPRVHLGHAGRAA
jgi:hypothetical protein